MENKYPIETLLRPPVELWSAMAALICTVPFVLTPNFIFLSNTAGYFSAVVLISLACYRFLQGIQIVRYQRHFKQLPFYTIHANQVPVNDTKLFLGKGFRWRPVHTQRLHETKQQEARKHKKVTTSIFHKLKEFIWMKNVESNHAIGGNPILHAIELREQNVWLDLNERVGHMLVLGTTRVGKTRLLELLATQDIHRGEVVIIFDPKGDTDLLRRIYLESQKANRLKDLIVFHLGFPEISARYNPVGEFARVTEVANRIANQLPNSGDSAAFKEFAWRFVNIVTRALVAMGERIDYQKLLHYLLDMDSLLWEYCKHSLFKDRAGWEKEIDLLTKNLDIKELPIHMRNRSPKLIALVQYIQEHDIQDPIADGLCSAFGYGKTYFDKITASLLPLIEKLTSGKIVELISPDYLDLHDDRPIFDWMQVIREKKIVYVGLDALSDKTVAEAVGNSMFADLCSVTGQLYKYGVNGHFPNQQKKEFYPICVHSDEFNELIGDEFIPLLNKAGGAKMQVTAYTQTWSDIEAKLGNHAKSGQIAGNFNNVICMRVLDRETASFFTEKLSQRVQVHHLKQISSVTDSASLNQESSFVSSNQDQIMTTEIPMLSPDDLIQLPKGQAFCISDGGQLRKIRIPLIESTDTDIPDRIETLLLKLKKSKQPQIFFNRSENG